MRRVSGHWGIYEWGEIGLLLPTVLQVIQQGQLRGAEVFALDLARMLAGQAGWQVRLLSLFVIHPAYRQAAVTAGIDVSVLGDSAGKNPIDWRVIGSLRDAIDRGRYDLVQANGAGTLKYVVAARRLARHPWHLVYRAIGMGSYWRRSVARRLVYRWLLGHPEIIVAVSRAVRDDLVSRSSVAPDKIVILPNGVDPSRVRSSPADRLQIRSALGIPPTDVVVAYLGSLSPEKNLGALLSAVAFCRRAGLLVRALLVGDGPARQGLEDRATRLGITSATHFISPQPLVGPYLAASDLCVLPSLSEGMPALLIEAGLAALPVVAYAVGGVSEVVDHGTTGMLVPLGDERRLGEAVAALAADSARRSAMGGLAQAHCRMFEIEAVATAYARTYQGLITERRAG